VFCSAPSPNAPPTSERFHPAGLILSTLGAILILYICIKLRIHFPASDRMESATVARRELVSE
jgi:hypothetical protein